MKPFKSSFSQILTLIIFIALMVSLAACTSTNDNSPTPTPGPTETTPDITINISANNLAFSTNTIRVPSGADVQINFENKESVSHNVAVYQDESASQSIFIGEIISGPRTISYRFTAPTTPGVYFFRCDVHPTTMTGDFITYGTAS